MSRAAIDRPAAASGATGWRGGSKVIGRGRAVGSWDAIMPQWRKRGWFVTLRFVGDRLDA